MTDDPLIGRKLSNFLVKRVLGRGGMAQVYYGQDVKLERPVAIKVIDVRYRNQPAYAKRFVKEARAVASWRHENIIQIYYADDQDGFYYYVMEYIDGKDLASLMYSYSVKGNFMPVEDVLRIGRAIASALDYAHAKGVIHRDIKPSNILMSKAGRVVLSDFGLALDVQQGSSGEAFGTPHYISPEQASRSTDAVPQSDLYSLGVILYEMLTGVVPFDDASPTTVAIQHITQVPPAPRSLNPQLNAETEAVLLKALSKKPIDRYQNGAALMDALAQALSKNKIVAQRVLPLPPMPAAIVAGKTRTVTQRAGQTISEKSVQKRRWPFVLLLFVILLLVVAGFGSMLKLDRFQSAASTGTASPSSLTTNTSIGPGSTANALPAVVPVSSATPSPLPTVTETSAPTLTAEPTLPLTRTSSPTSTPVNTAELASTATRAATEALPVTTTAPIDVAVAATASADATASTDITETPSATTTQQYPNEKRMWLYYDQYGLYIYNASNTNRSISPIAFERLDKDGNPSNRFDGWRWAYYFATLYTGRCMQIEVQNNPNNYLSPEVCKNQYLSRRSITADSDLIFWTTLPDSTSFRVLWKNEEVGQCDTTAGFCQVFVP
jgi:serine/threonine protein kinase